MVDMMTATRTYEANTAAVETTYQLVNMAMELGALDCSSSSFCG